MPPTAHGHHLVIKALHKHPHALRKLHTPGSAEDELATLVVRSAQHLDNVQAELVDRCTWAAEALTGGEQWPSTTLDHLVAPDGSPPVRTSVTERTASDQDLDWGYILRPTGIEVINNPRSVECTMQPYQLANLHGQAVFLSE